MKEYLLLRNNRESGPFSLEELKQMGLKAYDLVWIENRSYSWKYPSEITELVSFAPPLEVAVTGRSSEDLPDGWGAVQREETGQDDWMLNAKEPIEVPKSVQETQKQPGHVVAFRPRIENIRIKTIKSAAQPNVVKVEVREVQPFYEPLPEENSQNSEYLTVLPKPRLGQPLTGLKQMVFQKPQKLNLLDSLRILSDNNKMEMIVLAIGAASLLGVAYLMITAGY